MQRIRCVKKRLAKHIVVYKIIIEQSQVVTAGLSGAKPNKSNIEYRTRIGECRRISSIIDFEDPGNAWRVQTKRLNHQWVVRCRARLQPCL